MAKLQMRTRSWDIIVIVGTVLVLLAGFGGLFYLQTASSTATTTLVFVVVLGVLTFAFFAGPGIVYVARKRIPFIKDRLPGGTLAWIRAHLYLPVLALVAAWVHASVVPFQTVLSSGKVLLVLGIVVAVAGWARHKLIGIQKSAVNAEVSISRLAADQSRQFRQLVTDYRQRRRPLGDIEADTAALSDEQRVAWDEVVSIQDQVANNFPRGGGQSAYVRSLKVLRAIHAPLTIALFAVLGWHVIEVLGVDDEVLDPPNHDFASASTCATCHSDIVDDFNSSAMAHAQTSAIMQAQLPVTLGRNLELAELLGPDQQAIFDSAASSCVNCHAPAGAHLLDDPLALLPLDQAPPDGEVPIAGGNDAAVKDGITCVTCHTQDEPFDELAGFGLLPIETAGTVTLGGFHGPTLNDPNALPTRAHDIEPGIDGFFDDPISTSISCGACHNVKIDLDGDGLSPTDGGGDADGDQILDENELDNQDGSLDDLVLQTTYDEWQDYLAAFSGTLADALGTTRPLGCVDCHMPPESGPIVDYAPGALPVPDRAQRSHAFVGVDYDLDVAGYTSKGLDADVVNDVLAMRRALLQTAVTLEVDDPAGGSVDADQHRIEVVVTNNGLGHSFPTGFAFARQFWLEVTAVDREGEPVCLVEADGVPAQCGSGIVGDRTEPLPECNPGDVAAARGVDVAEVPNGDITFAAPSPVGECDPWLSNFQKILTDGDPGGSGTFTEVVYQAFLPDIVKERERVVDGQAMGALQSVRLAEDPETGELVADDTARLPYVFDSSGLAPGEQLTVTATLRFRHLPPEFVETLAVELQDFEHPPAAAIDADELLENLVITDVVTAATGDGTVVACPGPQNDPGASLFDCVAPVEGDGAVDVSGIGAPWGPGPWLGWALAIALNGLVFLRMIRRVSLERHRPASAS